MKGREPHHELDDELLSAYLDGELSGEDRAAVEARLDADPAAQQLLHELRSVSQAVQALPLEKLGRDLSDDVVRRAQAAKPTPLKTEPARSGRPIPELPIFGSTRSWFWASLTLAAGLLIMVFYPGDEQKNGLPNLAQRDDDSVARQPLEESKARWRREAAAPAASESKDAVAFTTDNQPTDKPASGAGGMPAKLASELRDSSEPAAGEAASVATGAAAPKNDHLELKLDDGSIAAKTPTAPQEADKLAKSPQAAGRAWGINRPDGAFGGGKLELATGAQPLVVVHVVAKREALDKKSFDQLLVSNGIAVEADRAKARAAGGAYGYGDQLKKEKSRQLGTKAGTKEPLDFVLVEAPAPTITRCVASLNKDSDNFTNIEVSEANQPNAWFDLKAVPNKKIAEDLTKYNRGAVPQQQKESLQQNDFATYFDVDVLRERVADESSREGQLGTAVSGIRQEVNGSLSDVAKHKSAENGRAWRIQTRFDDGRAEDHSSIRSGGISVRAGNTAEKQLAPERTLKEIKKLNGDRLYVLFVLSPQETPASAAAAAAASSPQPTVPTK